MTPKRYRFFYHYNKPLDKMTVHFRGVCYNADDIDCNPPARSKRNKTQPRLVMQGWARKVTAYSDVIVIS